MSNNINQVFRDFYCQLYTNIEPPEVQDLTDRFMSKLKAAVGRIEKRVDLKT